MKRSGQILLFGILIIAVLAIMIPLLVMTTRSLFNRQVHTQRQETLNEVVPAAFQTVQYLFSQKPELWKRALQGDALHEVGFDGSKTFSGVKNLPYTVTCSPGSQIQTIQVTIEVSGIPGGVSATRLFRGTFVRKTFGVDLPQLGHVPAAVYLSSPYPPASNGKLGQLDVHWGALVSFAALSLPDNTESDRLYGFHPRKICAGAYRRMSSSEADLKEVSQNVSLGMPGVIDKDLYLALAMNDEVPNPQKPSAMRFAYFKSRGIGAAFVADGYNITTGTDAVVVSGDAVFGNVGMDLGLGAMLITGNAVFTGQSQGLPLMLRVPAQADREYPYLPSGVNRPCAGEATCQPHDALGAPVPIDFRGFLYVQGNLEILRDTVIAGVLRVDGTLYIADGKYLTVFYDDSIGRAIATTQLELEQITP